MVVATSLRIIESRTSIGDEVLANQNRANHLTLSWKVIWHANYNGFPNAHIQWFETIYSTTFNELSIGGCILGRVVILIFQTTLAVLAVINIKII